MQSHSRNTSSKNKKRKNTKGKKKPKQPCFGFLKDLAATYSRGSYTTTTIGKTEFDGRVRDGNGSGLSFMTTKKC